MKAQVLKAGNGRLWGVSNPREQAGKTLFIYDGETLLWRIGLERAFPTRRLVFDEGWEELWPGIELNLIFVTTLRQETDGVDIDVFWF